MKAIYKISSASTIDYAAEELKKYLRMMMPDGGDIGIKYEPNARDGFRLGLMKDMGLALLDSENPELDDTIYIDTDTEGGIIAGSNPRAVLIAVYEYLRRNGCSWLMPGVDGEIIPMKDIIPVSYRHTPTMRVRGNCIEGAVSQQILLDFIDFMPKLGLNTFMIQFRNPKEFYQRFYDHWRNDEKRPCEPITDATAMQWTRAVECEMAKRGILLHSVGHGWTNDPYGIDSTLCWAEIDDSEIAEESLKYLALFKGKRGLYRGRPANTQICMSNLEARRLFVKCVADYAESHSNTDYLHVWLADDCNNHCECDACRKKRSSDWYVILLNEIDEELIRRGNDVKIVLAVYVDLCWPPIEEKIKNPERFLKMLAPITRDYTVTLGGGDEPEMKPYVLNNLEMPGPLDEYLVYEKAWKKQCKSDTFAFEYHFWKHHQYDLSGLQMAKRIYEDTLCYLERGISGIMQCGSQRGFTPNGFAFYVHARAQYDISVPYDELMREFYSAAYGDGWETFKNTLEKLSDAVPYEYLSQPKAAERPMAYHYPEMKPRIDSLPSICDELDALVSRHYNSPLRARTVVIRILERYVRFVRNLAAAFSHKCMGENDKAVEKYDKLRLELGNDECAFEGYDDFLQRSGFTKFMMLFNEPEAVNNANGE